MASKRSEYTFEYDLLLKHNLKMLEELNEELPKSIHQIKEKLKQDTEKTLQELNTETREQYEKAMDILLKSLKDMENQKTDMISIPEFLTGRAADLFFMQLQPAVFHFRFNIFIRDMSLVYLVAEMESFLQKILRVSFKERPELLMTCQKSITLEELLKFEKIEDAKQEIMEKEILSIINQDIEDVNKHFKQRFKIDLSRFVDWKEFKERFYRRNIIIHNSGLVNRLYRLKTGYRGKDKWMRVSQDYLNESIKLFDHFAKKASEYFHNKFRQ